MFILVLVSMIFPQPTYRIVFQNPGLPVGAYKTQDIAAKEASNELGHVSILHDLKSLGIQLKSSIARGILKYG